MPDRTSSSSNGKQNPGERDRKLPPPSVEGKASLLKTLRTWIEIIEETPDLRASPHSWQVVEARTRTGKQRGPGDPFDYHTGRAEWNLKVIVVKPVPMKDRVEGGEYA